jgi:hypothetical protein
MVFESKSTSQLSDKCVVLAAATLLSDEWSALLYSGPRLMFGDGKKG